MEELQDRVLLIDKPYGWTSFDVVNKVRKQLRIRKVGHAGTLDPLATGLLIVCTGRHTKQVDQFQALEKEYTGTLVLGQSTPSHDLETPVEETFPIDMLTESEIRAATRGFIGEIDQVPPLHSAIKIEGKRAYTFARKGTEKKLNPRRIFIREFEITRLAPPEADFRVVCSKGTYIRSLVRDFGRALNNGAYLKSLCRTRIGEFTLPKAVQLNDLA
jgi:tRNA pseudouridine55 synthase